MKKIIAIIMALTMVCALALVFTSCTDNKAPVNEENSTEADAATSMTATEGVLVMATNAAFPPYEFVEGGEYAGIDVEIAEKIAEKLGMTLEIKDVDFGAIIGGVQSGKFDMGMAGMTVTDERLESVNFSTTYATGIQVVIVAEDSDIKSLDDLKGDGSMKFGVQQDTTGDIYASDTAENGGYGEENVIRYKTGADAVQALKSGKVQAVIIDNEPAKSFVAANEGLKILDAEWAVEDYAIAIAKENTALLTAVNGALAALEADGIIDAIIAKYIPSAETASEAA
ncbi:MAG: transporter substrate-binding domain-containing protein [Clostridia bacterium]|nr:transporter substrate-binding domain-containing protein [Clostridia bacterium]